MKPATTTMLSRCLFAILAICLLYPVLQALGSAFWLNGPTLQHITAVFDDPKHIWMLLRNSLSLSGITVLLTTSVGVPLGFLLFRVRLMGRGLIIIGLLLAASIPLYVLAAAWTSLLGNAFWFSMESWWQKALVAGSVQAMAWLPWVILLSGTIFSSGDRELEEHCLLERGWLHVFFHVSIPNATWGIAATALLVSIFSLSDITITDTLRLITFQQECYTQFQLPDLTTITAGFEFVKPRRAAAVALPLIILLGALLWTVQRHLFTRGQADAQGIHHHLHQICPGPWRLPLSLSLAAVTTALLGIPLFRLLQVCGTWGSFVDTWGSTREEALTTFTLAALTATIATALSFVWGTVLVKPGTGWARLLLILLLAIPAPLVGIGLIVTMNNDLLGWFYDSRGMYIYAWLLRTLPYATLVIVPALRRIPKEIEEESRLCGATTMQYYLLVKVPMVWRGLLAAWLISFILSIGELGASFLVQTPGYTTLTVRFFTLVHSGVDSAVAGICLMVLCTVMLPASVLCLLLWSVLKEKL